MQMARSYLQSPTDMPELSRLKWEKEGKVVRVTLNRPEMHNSMDNRGTIELNQCVDDIATMDDVHIVVIRGAGKSFCSGIDLKELARDEIELAYHVRWESALRKLEEMEKIVIAGVHGHCLGGGLQLALACDIRVSADTSNYSLPAIKEALIPGLSTLRLSRYVGMGRAKKYILAGDNFSAQEAYNVGLVEYVVPEAEFELRLNEIVAHYLENCCRAMRLCKLLINKSFDLPHEEFMAKYMDSQAIAQTSKDHMEARRAYRENRKPVWE